MEGSSTEKVRYRYHVHVMDGERRRVQGLETDFIGLARGMASEMTRASKKIHAVFDCEKGEYLNGGQEKPIPPKPEPIPLVPKSERLQGLSDYFLSQYKSGKSAQIKAGDMVYRDPMTGEMRPVSPKQFKPRKSFEEYALEQDMIRRTVERRVYGDGIGPESQDSDRGTYGTPFTRNDGGPDPREFDRLYKEAKLASISEYFRWIRAGRPPL